MSEGVGDRFQDETRHRREELRPYSLDWEARPPTYKIYTDTPLFELPAPRTGDHEAGRQSETAPADLWSAIAERRSARRFTDDALALSELSQLLWASNGVTRPAPNHLFRAAPSAGGLYPIETYVVVNRVDGLPPGLYHYRVAGPNDSGVIDPEHGHALEQLRDEPLGEAVAQAALGQGMARAAAAVFIWTAVFERSRWKYRQRAFRYVYLDAGHIAAHVSLAAVALGLGSCQVAAFFDDEVDAIVGVDGESEGTVYMTVVGHPQVGRA